MSSNNLASHLQWLLTSKPCRTGQELPYTPRILENSNSIGSFQRRNSDTRGDGNLDERRESAVAAHSEGAEPDHAMNNAPATRMPTLLPTPRSARSSELEAHTSCPVPRRSPKKTNPISPVKDIHADPTVPPTKSWKPVSHPRVKLEIIDLTEDRLKIKAEHDEPPQVPSDGQLQTGRKRKSMEMQEEKEDWPAQEMLNDDIEQFIDAGENDHDTRKWNSNTVWTPERRASPRKAKPNMSHDEGTKRLDSYPKWDPERMESHRQAQPEWGGGTPAWQNNQGRDSTAYRDRPEHDTSKTMNVPVAEDTSEMLMHKIDDRVIGDSDEEPPMADEELPTGDEILEESDYMSDEVLEESDFMGDEDDADLLEAADEALAEPSIPSTYTPNRRPALKEISPNVCQAVSPATAKMCKSENAARRELDSKPWGAEVRDVMFNTFQMRGFRANQLEAINATLTGKDVFLLMPTGGGKSLCYQLPAIIRSAPRKGLTVVVSPLISLMEDQVTALRSKGVNAVVLNSDTDLSEKRMILATLQDPRPQNPIDLIYLTPEMLSLSGAMGSTLESLRSRNRLARLVIDEAHCVSQWGHDFRPEYTKLGEVREKLNGVPVMACTATATETVKADVISNLNIEGCLVLKQSFNRPNLTYEVRPKKKAADCVAEMAGLINQKFSGKSGIIYCFSRNRCEQVAEQLSDDYGIEAAHYHAGMKRDQRAQVQQEWQRGQTHVIVATIAFGMGIDKPDVRYVFHETIPKSLEGYYQETGRAGRDSLRSSCYLFWGMADFIKMKNMIEREKTLDHEQKDRQLAMLRKVTWFCDNKNDCRRAQVLRYFSEDFNKVDCGKTCDNCCSSSMFVKQDLTDYAAKAVSLVESIQPRSRKEAGVTLVQCIDVFKGFASRKVREMGYQDLPEFGAGGNLERTSKNSIERLFMRLIAENALTEVLRKNRAGFMVGYIFTDRRSKAFKNKQVKLELEINVSAQQDPVEDPVDNPKPASRVARATTSRSKKGNSVPASTYVSSPVVGRKPKQNSTRGAVYDDDDDDDSDAFDPPAKGRTMPRVAEDDGDEYMASFEPPRKAVKRRRSPVRGSPIRGDDQIASLSTIHRNVVDGFVAESKQDLQQIVMNRKLRAPPFTDSMLRHMAIEFPQDKDAFCAIPGIDEDKYELYGQQFLEKIRHTKQLYEEMMTNEEDRRIADPNRRNVVDLVSDEEVEAEVPQDPGPDMDLDEDLDDADFDAISQETSGYFNRMPAAGAKQKPWDSASHRRKVDMKGTRPPPKKKPRASKESRQSGGARGKPGGRYKRGRAESKPRTSTSAKAARTPKRAPFRVTYGGIQAMPL